MRRCWTAGCACSPSLAGGRRSRGPERAGEGGGRTRRRRSRQMTTASATAARGAGMACVLDVSATTHPRARATWLRKENNNGEDGVVVAVAWQCVAQVAAQR